MIVFSGHALAQKSSTKAVRALSLTTTNTGKVYYGNRNEPPRALEFNPNTVTTAQFLDNINTYFGIPAEFTFQETESNTDNLGMHHRLMQQYYRDIPVEGMGYRVHEKSGFVTSVNGKAVREIKMNVETAYSEESAFQLAVKYLQSKDTVFKQGKKLIVSKDFTYAPESFSMAYQFDIDVSFIERWRVSIDASTGKLINKVSLVNTCFNKQPEPFETGTGVTNYYGTKSIRIDRVGDYSRLYGQTEHGGRIGTYDFENANVLGLYFGFYNVSQFYTLGTAFSGTYYKPAVSVHWAAEQAYEYYFKEHNRNSFDNNGSAITSYVHVDVGLNNAFWIRNLLAFGDGTNNNPLVELDVVSHELTHGVTQYEAGLQYYYESGALNESFSDIFGKAVEFYTFGDSATWQLARHYRTGGLRDFSNPNLKDQPDTYEGDMWYTGYEDSGGVHYNSGVQNFWYYLLCEGGSGVNDHQVNYSVNAIGMEAATKIAYRNLTEYMSYASDYLDSRIGSMLATADLYGKGSAIYQEVDKAWDAVGVIDEPIIKGFEFYDITATTVKIKGDLVPRGSTTKYHFEYGLTPALGSISSDSIYTNRVEGILTGLQSSAKYYVRLVAINENGTTFLNSDFTTISLAPLVKIKRTVDVTETNAILYGQVNPNSLATSFYFEYGPTQAFGLVTPSFQLSDTSEFLNVSATIANLQPRQTYYYRLVATNGFASVPTESISFFTAVKPVISSCTPISGNIGTEVTITGKNFNPLSAKNIVSFGATHAKVLSSSTSEIKVEVPKGASFGSITVLDVESGLAAQSAQEFVPTFTDDFKKGDLQLRAAITAPYVWRTFVQDMDGDGRPDIVGIHYQGFTVFQNVNEGGDLTNESFLPSTFPVLDFYSSDGFQVLDFDGNGLKDVVGRSQYGLRIYPNLSVPGYVFFGTPIEIRFDKYMEDLVFDDFDMDGRIDIGGITSLAGIQSFTVLRNQNPKGSLASEDFQQQYTKLLPYYPRFVNAGDLNNDGRPDLVLSEYNADFAWLLENNSSPGVFDFQEDSVVDETQQFFARYIAHDFNQDGWRDIASHTPYDPESLPRATLAILRNKRTESDISMELPVVMLNGIVQSIIVPGDINGDGKVDIVAGLSDRKFLFLKNRAEAGQPLSSSSFEKFEEYGLPMINKGDTDFRMTISDLNGDGRPEIINEYSYSFGPHDQVQMEIWQNSPNDCLDPSLISNTVSGQTVTVVLPPNTTFEQVEIEYTPAGTSYWWRAYSTKLDLAGGYPYQIRVRAKCYLGFTNYHYMDVMTDCINTSYFAVQSVGVNNVVFNYTNYSFEVQCSPQGKNQWLSLPLYSNQIGNLLSGTTYDWRIRGLCPTPATFRYEKFTTVCPKLSSLYIVSLTHNQATLNWTSDYTVEAILEYSSNNLDWNPIGASLTLDHLIPGTQYIVRGKVNCSNAASEYIYTSFTTACPVVSNLSVQSVTQFTATVYWTDESDSHSYLVKYSSPDGETKTIQTDFTSIQLDNLSPGTNYEVTVAPGCIGVADFRNLSFTTLCYEPFNLLVNSTTQTTAELSWEDNIELLPYSVEYSISGSSSWKKIETEDRSLSLTQLRPGTEYQVSLYVACQNVTSVYLYSNFRTELYSVTTLAPNPTSEKITIYPSKNLIGSRCVIYDNAGRKLVDGDLIDYTLDISSLSPGIYILKISGESPIKIVKN